ncbi:hypothetical protein CAFE_28250 [Caprobacter fermentans]|uniref:Uncharacterized protein n=1 Tax=Caproicibacter fermentans TaxID=2576756 RepID=A0A6N8I1Z0_9FIRM|nr:hypothetical protein [Caproicibacter fermentans]MVB12094.1 hypothetical protein [Caproicibacter fermentans]OCN02267.1 hypothetical protein A7X67_06365 [Clostridium sp. W14A]
MSYKSVIDSFHVETNAKYQPTSSATYCNIFAQDVMRAMKEPLPSGTCSTMLRALQANKYPNWKPVSANVAQSRANAGYGTIGITSDHIVVIYPHGNTASSVSDLYMSMAGYKCFNDTRITYAWKSSVLSTVKFYSYYSADNVSFTCDTHSTVTIKKGNKYQARITCSQYPTVVAGTGGIVSISLASQSGDNYYFAFTGINTGSTGIYINKSSTVVFVCKVV